MYESDLACALRELARELREQREERVRGLATKADLCAMESRIMGALENQVTENDRVLLTAILNRMARSAKKLEALDAKTAG